MPLGAKVPNDFDDKCDGYIVVVVDKVDGQAVRPVVGIRINEIEPIEQALSSAYPVILSLYGKN